jgi:hypothetical protein
LSIQRLPLGNRKPPRVGPRELKPLTASSLRVVVPNGLTAPTVIAEGSCPGDDTVP